MFDLFTPYENYSSFQIALETLAALMGVASVLFFIKKSILGYPSGIISTTLYTYLLYGWGLYGDMLINFYYTLMSIYGWWYWNKDKETHRIYEITRLNKQDWLKITGFFSFSFLFTLAVYYLKNNYLHPIQTKNYLNYTEIDWVDCTTTSLFLIGMYLMAKLKLEHWIFWILGNFISIPLYHIKGYDITALQYLVFLGLAIQGYFTWKKDYRSQINSI